MGISPLIRQHNHGTTALFGLKTYVAYYAHITTQLEDTYVCNPEILSRSIGLAFSSLKTTYNRNRLMIPMSGLVL
jgi:hypothetical protein